MHKLLNFADPTKNYVVSKLVMGSYRTRPCLDIRLPITLLLLDKLIDALYHTAPNFYEITLFKAMYLFAFYAFARIGEITENKNASYNVVQYNDIECNKLGSFCTITVTFRQYKHNASGVLHQIELSRGHSKYDPVEALNEYFSLRGTQSGPLFCMLSGKPVKRHAFDLQLHKTLKFCRLDSSRYKGHSFRIGAASFRSEQGDSDSQIRALRRWKSNAFQKYLRTHNR